MHDAPAMFCNRPILYTFCNTIISSYVMNAFLGLAMSYKPLLQRLEPKSDAMLLGKSLLA